MYMYVTLENLFFLIFKTFFVQFLEIDSGFDHMICQHFISVTCVCINQEKDVDLPSSISDASSPQSIHSDTSHSSHGRGSHGAGQSSQPLEVRAEGDGAQSGHEQVSRAHIERVRNRPLPFMFAYLIPGDTIYLNKFASPTSGSHRDGSRYR